jgi:hypothetical protein
MPPSRHPPPHIITMHIFFVHFGFGLNPSIFVKVVLIVWFLFHVCGVFGFILYVGFIFFCFCEGGVLWRILLRVLIGILF